MHIKREKLLEVKDEWYKKKLEFDKEVQSKKQKLSNLEKQLNTREENNEKKFELILQRERENKKLENELQELQNSLLQKKDDIEKLEQEQNTTCNNSQSEANIKPMQAHETHVFLVI